MTNLMVMLQKINLASERKQPCLNLSLRRSNKFKFMKLMAKNKKQS